MTILEIVYLYFIPVTLGASSVKNSDLPETSGIFATKERTQKWTKKM